MRRAAAAAALGRAWHGASSCWGHDAAALGAARAAALSTSSAPAAAAAASSAPAEATAVPGVRWVFLGPPGVGKGTYASRIAAALGVPHIAAGDLVRDEIKSGSDLGKQMREVVGRGALLPDETVIALLQRRLAAGASSGERGFLLDGFPRTAPQAQRLEDAGANVTLALNLGLRREVLVEKCCGRRICRHCGANYNVADIYLAADAAEGRPEIVMPPLSPPPECAPHLETREDDTADVVRRRLDAYAAAAAPVEAFYRARGLLLDFEITGGIPQTAPRLLAALAPHLRAAGLEVGDAATAARVAAVGGSKR